VDIVVRGRNVEVPEHYRHFVAEKVGRIERFDHKVIRIDVELQHEPNPRQSSACQNVQITCKSRGPVVRSEACAHDFYSALEAAVSKLEARLRRAADRRRVHYGHNRPPSVSDAVDRVDAAPAEVLGATSAAMVGAIDGDAAARPDDAGDVGDGDGDQDDGSPGRIVREKEHSAAPMTVDQALFAMELVGHDFYLFADATTGLASVVYRRKGFDYGVIRLTESPATAVNGAAPQAAVAAAEYAARSS
jgi:ribosomal subunit interface protein